MTPSLIAEIKDGAQVALRSDSHPYHARRVIDLCEEVERLQKELAEARKALEGAKVTMAAWAEDSNFDPCNNDNYCRVCDTLASSQG